jgi:hypothetical protein
MSIALLTPCKLIKVGREFSNSALISGEKKTDKYYLKIKHLLSGLKNVNTVLLTIRELVGNFHELRDFFFNSDKTQSSCGRL